MQKKTINLTLSILAALLFIIAAAGTASAVSLEIDLPDTAYPGETITGNIWIKNIGETDNKLTAYTVALTADSSLNPHIDYTQDFLNLGGAPQVNDPMFIAESCDSGYHTIDPSSQKLCTIKITIPAAASVGTSYTIDFNQNPQKTFLITYDTYYEDGITGHGSGHGPLTPAQRTCLSDTITVAALPGTTHTVTFYNETDVEYMKTTVQSGSTVSKPADPVKEGYTLSSWNLGSPSGTQYDFSTPVFADLKLYANWTINKYPVSFVMNGHGTQIPSQNVAYNTQAEEPTPAPAEEGYTFNGWYTDTGLTAEYDFTVPVKSAVTLYANWTANTYSITYLTASHGTVSGTASAPCGSTVTITASPASGYQFEKLIVTKSGTETPVTTSGKTFVMPAFNVNVTAEFTIIPTPTPTSSYGGGGNEQQQSVIIQNVQPDGQIVYDITSQYSGRTFMGIGLSPEDIAAIRAVNPDYAAELESKFFRAEANGIRLTNNKGSPVIVTSDYRLPNLELLSFSRVYDISSANPGEILTQVTVTVPKAEITASGLTTDDVTIYHYLSAYDIWVPLDTLWTTEDTSNYYYTAATDGASPFGVLIKRFQKAIPTLPIRTPQPQTTTPSPIIGLLAGLGTAALLFGLRKK